MSETTAPDYPTIALENMQEMELKRGLVAAELDACEAELRELYGTSSGVAHHRRGHFALEAVLGDEEAGAELEGLKAREAYLKGRASLCRDAIAYADERLEALRRTWLRGHQAAHLPLGLQGPRRTGSGHPTPRRTRRPASPGVSRAY
jgi:hypothetical protein